MLAISKPNEPIERATINKNRKQIKVLFQIVINTTFDSR